MESAPEKSAAFFGYLPIPSAISKKICLAIRGFIEAAGNLNNLELKEAKKLTQS
jgi:hypothetical protein